MRLPGSVIDTEAILKLGMLSSQQALLRLSDFLRSPDPEMRVLAAHALALRGGALRARALLEAFKREKDEAVRIELVTALSRFFTNAGVARALLDALWKDPAVGVQVRIAELMPPGRKIVHQAWIRVLTSHPRQAVRLAVLRSIGLYVRLQQPASTIALRAASIALKDKARAVQLEGVRVLDHNTRSRATMLLMWAYRRSPYKVVCWQAIKALTRRNEKIVSDFLKGVLFVESSAPIRELAFEALLRRAASAKEKERLLSLVPMLGIRQSAVEKELFPRRSEVSVVQELER